MQRGYIHDENHSENWDGWHFEMECLSADEEGHYLLYGQGYSHPLWQFTLSLTTQELDRLLAAVADFHCCAE